MYSEIDALGLAEAEARRLVAADRRRYAPFYAAAEALAHERRMLVGGAAGRRLLLGAPPDPIALTYEFFSDQALADARALADALHAVDPEGLGKYANMRTLTPQQEFAVSVDERPLFRVTAFAVTRRARSADIILPATRPANYAKGGGGEPLPLLCLGPELQLIDVYRALMNPARSGEWVENLQAEERLRALFLARARTSIAELTRGGAEEGPPTPPPTAGAWSPFFHDPAEPYPPDEEPCPPAEEPCPPAEEARPPAEEARPPAEEARPPAEEARPPAAYSPVVFGELAPPGPEPPHPAAAYSPFLGDLGDLGELGDPGDPRSLHAAEGPLRRLMKAVRAEFVPRSGHVAVGGGAGRRIQVVTANRLEDEEAAVGRIARRLGLQIQTTTNDPKVPTDPRLRRMTVYRVRGGARRAPFLDIYNTAAYELVPAGPGRPPRAGTPFVRLRFLLVDIWTMLLIHRMGAVDGAYARAILGRLVGDYEGAAGEYARARARAGATGDYAPLFPDGPEAYVGRWADPVVAKKRRIHAEAQAARRRGRRARHWPYYPARAQTAPKKGPGPDPPKKGPAPP